MSEKILYTISILLVIFLIILGIYSSLNQNENINLDNNQTGEKNNSERKIKCGWLFGSGFKCGIGF